MVFYGRNTPPEWRFLYAILFPYEWTWIRPVILDILEANEFLRWVA